MVNAKRVIGAAAVAGVGGLAVYGLSRGGSDEGYKPHSSGGSNTGVNKSPVEEEGATGEDSGSDSGDGSGEESTKTKTKVVEVPIDNYEEALAFANREWNKVKRDNGRSLECSVLGSAKWKTGEWCKVYIPRFDIDGYMYISRASQTSDGGEWSVNLTLVDYPPGWGKEEIEDNSDDDDENGGSGDVANAISQITKEIGSFSYSGACSDGECIKTNKTGDCWALSDYIYKRLKESGVQARVHQYATSSSDNHRQVEYYDGKNWIMFPYSNSGIDHTFYTNEIPSGTQIIQN